MTSPHLTPRNRRWLPRFSLRRLLLVTALLALPLAWFGNLWHRVQHQRQIVTRIEAMGGDVGYDYEFGMGHEIGAPTDIGISSTYYETLEDGRQKRTLTSAAGEIVEIEQPPGPRLMRWMLGDNAFAHIDAVRFGLLRITPPTVDPKLFRELPELKAITLIGSQINDDHVTAAAKVPHLRALMLAGHEDSNVSREAIESLAQAKELRSLDLSNEWVTDETAAGVEKLPHLRSLGFSSSPQLTSDVFTHIRHLTNLQELSFFRSKGVDDQGTHHLRELKNLRILRLTGTSISSATGEHLAGLSRLESLGLPHSQFGDAGLRQFANLSRLVVLDVSFTNVTDDGIAVLSRLPRLRHLNLGGTKITDQSLPILGQLTQLQSLELYPCEITDAGLIHLHSLQNLKRLTIGPHITAAAADELRAALPNCKVSRLDKDGHASFPDVD